MQEYSGTYFPDGEIHLIEWCKAAKQSRDGYLCYQLTKYQEAMKYCPTHRRRTAVDVGAHVGQWSRVMAMDFDRVISFEPVGLYRECFVENMRDFPNHTLHALALGNHSGIVRLANLTPGRFGDTGVMADDDDSEAFTTAPVEPLDDAYFETLDFVKIDCEGYELDVVKGAEATLAKHQPVVIVEQKPGHAQRYGHEETEAVRFLERLGAVVRAEMIGDFVLSWP